MTIMLFLTVLANLAIYGLLHFIFLKFNEADSLSYKNSSNTWAMLSMNSFFSWFYSARLIPWIYFFLLLIILFKLIKRNDSRLEIP